MDAGGLPMSASKQTTVLCLGFAEEMLKDISETWPQLQFLSKPYNFENAFEQDIENEPMAILCGDPIEGMALEEAAQALRMQFPSAGIYLIVSDRSYFQRRLYIKNGMTDVFLWPIEKDVFENVFSDVFAQNSSGELKLYRSVRLSDFGPEAVPDFDTFVYMPANKKYVRISCKGRALDEKKLLQLGQKNLSSLYIDREETDKFNAFAKQRLEKKGSKNTTSQTARREETLVELRDVFTEIISEKEEKSIERGRILLDRCLKVISHFDLASNDDVPVHALASWIGDKRDFYTSALATSVVAAIFSKIAGIGNPTEMALSGLLHDIGLACIPMNEGFETHPRQSVEMLQRAKLILGDTVLKTIHQHHERYDGSGFPDKTLADRICPEAFLLGIADMFVDLTGLTPGISALTVEQAILRIEELNNSTGKYHLAFSPQIVAKLVANLRIRDLAEKEVV